MRTLLSTLTVFTALMLAPTGQAWARGTGSGGGGDSRCVAVCVVNPLLNGGVGTQCLNAREYEDYLVRCESLVSAAVCTIEMSDRRLMQIESCSETAEAELAIDPSALD